MRITICIRNFFNKQWNKKMKNKISKSLIAIALLFAISLSTALIAAEKQSEIKIQTNAYSFFCKDKIEQNIKEIDGVSDCFLNLDDKVATITYNPTKVKVEALKDKITALGYEAQILPANNSSAEKDVPSKSNLN